MRPAFYLFALTITAWVSAACPALAQELQNRQDDSVTYVVATVAGIEVGERDHEWQQRQYRDKRRRLGLPVDDNTTILSTGGRGWTVKLELLDVFGSAQTDENDPPDRASVWSSGHYGLPEFAFDRMPAPDEWLLRLRHGFDGLTIVEARPVVRTDSGDPFICGMPRNDDGAFQVNDPAPPTAHPIDVAPAYAVDLDRRQDSRIALVDLVHPMEEIEAETDSNERELLLDWRRGYLERDEELLRRRYAASDWVWQDSAQGQTRAICKRGVPVAAHVAHTRRTRDRRYRVEDHCIRSLAPTVIQNPTRESDEADEAAGRSIVRDGASGLRYESDAVDACVAQLYPSGWHYTD